MSKKTEGEEKKEKGSDAWKWIVGLGALGIGGYLVYKWWEGQQQPQGIALGGGGPGGFSVSGPFTGTGGGPLSPTGTSPSTNTATRLVQVLTGQAPSQTPGQASFAENAVQNFINTIQHAANVVKATQNVQTAHSALNFEVAIQNLAKSTAQMLQSPAFSAVTKLANLQISERKLTTLNNYINQLTQPPTQSTPVPIGFGGARHPIMRGSYYTGASPATSSSATQPTPAANLVLANKKKQQEGGLFTRWF